MNTRFDNIRPYNQKEVLEAFQRIKNDPVFLKAVQYFHPEYAEKEIVSKIEKLKTNLDFQKTLFYPVIRRIIENSSAGLTFSGFEKLNADCNHLFISNHRDIFLDAGILQILLVEHNHPTSEITLGSNLMMTPMITDVAKICKMYTVHRAHVQNKMELFKKSRLLSEYMRYSITEKKVSSWVAQANGRAKDGNDITQTGLLKMLNMSGENDLIKNFEELNIQIIAISYEWEPCDLEKTRERYISLSEKYIKQPMEDLHQIISGVKTYKGKIHFSTNRLPVEEIYKISGTHNDKIKALAKLIDQLIYQNFKLYPNNFIAYDMQHNTQKYLSMYSEKQKQKFSEYADAKIRRIGGDNSVLRKLFLEIYANPVENSSKYQKKNA